jgi:hypothetical protein
MGFADELKKRADRAAEAARRTAEEARRAVRGVLEYRERPLTETEISLAKKVFGETLPYGAIYLSNALGLQERAYTVPHPAKAASYVIHIGVDGFTDASAAALDRTLIHELTHVWQGVHRAHRLDYIFDSLHKQAQLGSAAYDYVAGADWSSYGAEQQAEIVEDWYRLGMNEADPRFRYIRDNVRAGID